MRGADGQWSKNLYPSGVTSILGTLYDQRALLDWYSSTTASAMVKDLVPLEWDKLDKAFLSIYKGEDPSSLGLRTINFDPIELYKLGINAPHVKSKYGTDVGTQVHNAVDHYHKTGQEYIEPSDIDEQDKVALKSFIAYVKWFEQSNLTVIESEVPVYSIKYNYAGTLDRIYKRQDGGLIMGDFKTSNLSRSYPMGIHAQYWSQLGAYMVGYIEEHRVEFVDTVIVNSPKVGSIKIGYGSDMGITPLQCQQFWLDDYKAMNNHKVLEKALKTLKSRTTEE